MAAWNKGKKWSEETKKKMSLARLGQDVLEHKIPLSRGGTNEYSNLEIAHRSCNSKKRNKTIEEYVTWLKDS